jgi:hypothetical protein
MDDESMKFGLLMESAQAHQRLAEAQIEKLRAHTQDLDGVVREEIRRTLVDELKCLTAETDRAAQALRGVRHAVNRRSLVSNIGLAVLCTALPAIITRYVLPNRDEIESLRLRRDALTQNIRELERRGAKLDLRTCGEPPRLCVRIDRKAPVFGAEADFYVVKGY